MGTPERPNGWVRTKLHGTLKLLRGPPECRKGWARESSMEPLGHSRAPPSVLVAG